MIFISGFFGLLTVAGYFVYRYGILRLQDLQRQITGIREELSKYQLEQSSLVHADLTFAKQITEINTHLGSITAHVHRIENQRQNDGGYQHALKILEMGGDKEEIIKSCHLSNAEAELLMNLNAYRHVMKKTETC